MDTNIIMRFSSTPQNIKTFKRKSKEYVNFGSANNHKDNVRESGTDGTREAGARMFLVLHLYLGPFLLISNKHSEFRGHD